MNILFLLDPFFDSANLGTIRNRAYVLRYDMMPTVLKRQAGLKNEIWVAALAEIFAYCDNETLCQRSKLHIHKFNQKLLNEWKRMGGYSLREVFNKDFSESEIESLHQFFPQCNPDLVLIWGFSGKFIQSIYPNAVIYQCEHSAFYRLFKESDIYFEPIGRLEKTYKDFISGYILNENEKYQIASAKSNFYDAFIKNLCITKSSLGLSESDKLIFFPGHFESPYYEKYSKRSCDLEVLHDVLSSIPSNWKILYCPHPLSKLSENSFIEKNERIINLSKLIGKSDLTAIVATNLADVVVNSHSKTVFFAYLLNKPVVEIDEFSTKFVSSYDLSEIEEICAKGINAKQDVLLYFTIKRTITHSLLNEQDAYSKIADELFSIGYSEQWKDFLTINSIDEFICKISNNVLNSDGDAHIRRTPGDYEKLKFDILFNAYKTIGFDIFDTLLMRPFMRPTDLFYLISGKVSKIVNSNKFDFFTARVASEWNARKKAYDHNLEDPTIDDVYDSLKKLFGVDEKIAQAIKTLEINTEKSVLRPRLIIKSLYSLAKDLGKRTIAVSDMYLTSEILKDILAKNGYCLDNIYVSCEIGTTKHSGLLYKKLIENKSIVPDETIFIGDNVVSDFQNPAKFNIKSYHLPSPSSLLKTTGVLPVYFNPIISQTISAHLGLIACRYFDNPYRRSTKSFINHSYYGLGYNAFGPLLLSFIGWLCEHLKSNTGKYNKVLFCSRDCWLLEKIYARVREFDRILPEGVYAYISRSSTLALFKDRLNAPSLIDRYNSKYSAYDFLVRYYGQTDVNLERIKSDKKFLNKITLDRIGKATISEYVSDKLLQSSEDFNQIGLIKEYIANLTNNCEFAIVDSGARGTSRDALSDLLEMKIDLFLFREFRYKNNASNKIYSYHKDSFNYFRNGRPSLASKFYEPIISNTLETTCVGYERQGNDIIPLVDCKEVSPKSFKILLIQKGILDFSNNFIDWFGAESINLINEPPTDVFKAPIEYIYSGFDSRDIFSELEHSDDMSESGAISLLMPPLVVKPKPQKQIVARQSEAVYRPANMFEKKIDIFIKSHKNTKIVGKLMMAVKSFYISSFMRK